MIKRICRRDNPAESSLFAYTGQAGVLNKPKDLLLICPQNANFELAANLEAYRMGLANLMEQNEGRRRRPEMREPFLLRQGLPILTLDPSGNPEFMC